MNTFQSAMFVAGAAWLGSIAVLALAVCWSTVRDAARRKWRLHRLRVFYAKALDHGHDLERRRRIARYTQQSDGHGR